MVQLSPAASREIERFQKTRSAAESVFRLAVQSGGCLGMIYSMRLDDSALPGDRIYESERVRVVVDAQSLPYLEGVVLDYSEDLMGGAFRFHNPRAIANCECGHSFTIAES
ncbi:MAG: iron-sulfur cluster assembly accessory protein [Cyanobacteria bacterium J069]|nr:MAG: iron-sulfur cluster assembly accessory protein [Cyanobacteria bacterium J069]